MGQEQLVVHAAWGAAQLELFLCNLLLQQILDHEKWVEPARHQRLEQRVVAARPACGDELRVRCIDQHVVHNGGLRDHELPPVAPEPGQESVEIVSRPELCEVHLRNQLVYMNCLPVVHGNAPGGRATARSGQHPADLGIQACHTICHDRCITEA
jgi:hypothetical protein